jgi:hypothetical protein
VDLLQVIGAIKTTPWAYPALEVFHITGIALLLGNLVLLELRVFGRGALLPVRACAPEPSPGCKRVRYRRNLWPLDAFHASG